MVPSKQKAVVSFYLLLVLALLAFGIGGYFTHKYGLTKNESVSAPVIVNPDNPVTGSPNPVFECPDTKVLDCSPCTQEPCPEFYPQYCSKGSAQYNFIIENCPGVEIVGLE